MKLLFAFLLAICCNWVVQADHKVCPCLYETADEGECTSYSKNVVGNALQEWPAASDTCLNTLNIQQSILPSELFWHMCPFPNRTDVDYAEIIAFLRGQPDHKIAREIYELFLDRNLFVEKDGQYVLLDEIQTGNQQRIQCTDTPNLCWNQVRVEMEGRKQKINALCANLHERQVAGWQSEQATARLLLCAKPEPACEPLSSEVQKEKPFGNDCSNFGVIVAKQDLPDCDGHTQHTTSGASSWSSVFSGAIILVSLAVAALH